MGDLVWKTLDLINDLKWRQKICIQILFATNLKSAYENSLMNNQLEENSCDILFPDTIEFSID